MIFQKKNLILARAVYGAIAAVFVFETVVFPLPALAYQENVKKEQRQKREILTRQDSPYLDAQSGSLEKPDLISIRLMSGNSEGLSDRLPENRDAEEIKVSHRTITAYTSEAIQCDASPCVTANGFNVCEHGIEDTIADNSLPFGTKVKIPELFGDKIFIVRDRMSSRYQNRTDIWMKDKKSALLFGKKFAKIVILK